MIIMLLHFHHLSLQKTNIVLAIRLVQRIILGWHLENEAQYLLLN